MIEVKPAQTGKPTVTVEMKVHNNFAYKGKTIQCCGGRPNFKPNGGIVMGWAALDSEPNGLHLFSFAPDENEYCPSDSDDRTRRHWTAVSLNKLRDIVKVARIARNDNGGSSSGGPPRTART